MEENTILIDGMSCQHCVARVKKAIEALAGVKGLNVSVGKAEVSFDGSETGIAEIKDAIAKAGYKIRQ